MPSACTRWPYLLSLPRLVPVPTSRTHNPALPDYLRNCSAHHRIPHQSLLAWPATILRYLLDKATPTATVCFFFANDELQSAKCLVLRSLAHGGLCRWHALAGEVKWQHPRLFLLRSCDPVRQVALLVSRRLLAVAAYGGLRPSS